MASSELIELEAALDEPFAALPWPQSAGVILLRVEEALGMRLLLSHEMPRSVREFIQVAVDALEQAKVAIHNRSDAGRSRLEVKQGASERDTRPDKPDGAGQGADDDLPRSWRVR